METVIRLKLSNNLALRLFLKLLLCLRMMDMTIGDPTYADLYVCILLIQNMMLKVEI